MLRRHSGTITVRQALVQVVGRRPEDITEADEIRMERIFRRQGLVPIFDVVRGVKIEVWIDAELVRQGGYAPSMLGTQKS